MITVRMNPGDADRVAEVFARSDATSMPQEIGVPHRSLFTFHELDVLLIQFDRPPGEAMRVAQALPSFRSVSEELRAYITAYDPGWRSPQDAMARRFYEWSAER